MANETDISKIRVNGTNYIVKDAEARSDLDSKVDKVTGKGLSTEDFTSAEKTKLAGIAAGAEVNVQSDWSATSGDAFIKNKPTLGTAASKDTGTGSGNVPVLDANGKLDSAVLPAIAVSETFTAATQAAMLALDAQVGDVCVRTDESKTYILVKTPASTLANWKLLEHPADAVSSVNSKTGVVTLTTDDISDVNQAHKFVIELEDNSTTTAGTWLAKTNAITSLEDGQMFLYKITVAGASTTTLNITANGTALGAKTVYRVNTTKLTTQYAVGHYLLLVYNSLNTCFRVVNDSDANSDTKVRQYQSGSNAAGSGTKYPVLTRYGLTNKSGSYDANYARFHTDVTVDTSDGTLYAITISATTLQEDGTNLENKYLGISAKATDSDKLDGHDSTYFQQALPTTTTAGKVLKSTATAGTVQWADDTNTNQTVKGNGTAFSANDAINIVGSGAATVTADTTNKKITIHTPNITFTETTVNFVSGSYSDGVLQLTPATTTVWVPNISNN